MQSQTLVPCKCTNPRCHRNFVIPIPIHVQGSNNHIINNSTQCPSCGHPALMASMHTDEHGKLHISDFFNLLQSHKDINKLNEAKKHLQKVSHNATIKEVVDTLTDIDPEFEKYTNVIKSIPVGMIIELLILMVAYMSYTTLGKQHSETMEMEESKLAFEREKFKYEKEHITKNETDKDIKKVSAEIEKLKHEFETKLQQTNKNQKSAKNNKSGTKSKLKGKDRNKLCSCGSGKKAKNCHPLDYYNYF